MIVTTAFVQPADLSAAEFVVACVCSAPAVCPTARKTCPTAFELAQVYRDSEHYQAGILPNIRCSILAINMIGNALWFTLLVYRAVAGNSMYTHSLNSTTSRMLIIAISACVLTISYDHTGLGPNRWASSTSSSLSPNLTGFRSTLSSSNNKNGDTTAQQTATASTLSLTSVQASAVASHAGASYGDNGSVDVSTVPQWAVACYKCTFFREHVMATDSCTVGFMAQLRAVSSTMIQHASHLIHRYTVE
jgi:hypothetical protein